VRARFFAKIGLLHITIYKNSQEDRITKTGFTQLRTVFTKNTKSTFLTYTCTDQGTTCCYIHLTF